MPKQNHELSKFVSGTITTPSAEDVSPEAAIYSKNLEPLDEQGKLKGVKEDLKVKPINEGFSVAIYGIPAQIARTNVENEDGILSDFPAQTGATEEWYNEDHGLAADIVIDEDIDKTSRLLDNPNLITNGDFEDGMTGWSAGAQANGTIPAIRNTGSPASNGAQILCADEEEDTNSYMSQYYTIKSGDKFKISYRILENISGQLAFESTETILMESSVGNHSFEYTFIADDTAFVFKRGVKDTNITIDDIVVTSMDTSDYVGVSVLKENDKIQIYNKQELLGEAEYIKNDITGTIGSNIAVGEDDEELEKDFTHNSDPDDTDTACELEVHQFYQLKDLVSVVNSSSVTMDVATHYTFDATTNTVIILNATPDDVYTIKWNQEKLQEDAPYDSTLFTWDGTTELYRTKLKVSAMDPAIGGSVGGFDGSPVLINDTLKGRVIQITNGSFDGAYAIIKSNTLIQTTILNDDGTINTADYSDVNENIIPQDWYWEIEHTPLRLDSPFDYEYTLTEDNSINWENGATFKIIGGNNETWEALKTNLLLHEDIDTISLLTSEEDDPVDFGIDIESLDEGDVTESIEVPHYSTLTYDTDITVDNPGFEVDASNWTIYGGRARAEDNPDNHIYYAGDRNLDSSLFGSTENHSTPDDGDGFSYINWKAFGDISYMRHLDRDLGTAVNNGIEFKTGTGAWDQGLYLESKYMQPIIPGRSYLVSIKMMTLKSDYSANASVPIIVKLGGASESRMIATKTGYWTYDSDSAETDPWETEIFTLTPIEGGNDVEDPPNEHLDGLYIYREGTNNEDTLWWGIDEISIVEASFPPGGAKRLVLQAGNEMITGPFINSYSDDASSEWDAEFTVGTVGPNNGRSVTAEHDGVGECLMHSSSFDIVDGKKYNVNFRYKALGLDGGVTIWTILSHFRIMSSDLAANTLIHDFLDIGLHIMPPSAIAGENSMYHFMEDEDGYIHINVTWTADDNYTGACLQIGDTSSTHIVIEDFGIMEDVDNNDNVRAYQEIDNLTIGRVYKVTASGSSGQLEREWAGVDYTTILGSHPRFYIGPPGGGLNFSGAVASFNVKQRGGATVQDLYFKATGTKHSILLSGSGNAGEIAYFDSVSMQETSLNAYELQLNIPEGNELLSINRVYWTSNPSGEDPVLDSVDFVPGTTNDYYFDRDTNKIYIDPDNVPNPVINPGFLNMEYEHDSIAKDNVQYNNIQVSFVKEVEEIEIEARRISEEGGELVTYSSLDDTTQMDIEDVTEYFQIDADQMIMFNEKDIQNIIFYSITTGDNEVATASYDNETNTWSGTQNTFRMKVLSNIYENPSIETSYTDDDGNTIHNDIPTEPVKVSLQKSSAAIYIGTGNEDKTKSKWFGKLFHTQFGKTLEGYILDDAECFPLDDKGAVYHLDYTQNAYISGTWNVPWYLGLSSSTRKIHLVYTNRAHEGDANDVGTDSENEAKGIQIALGGDGAGLGYRPGAVAPSVYFTESMTTRTDDSTNNTGDHIFNNGLSNCIWPPTGETGSTSGYKNVFQISQNNWADFSYSDGDGIEMPLKNAMNESGMYWVSDKTNNEKLTCYHLKLKRSLNTDGVHSLTDQPLDMDFNMNAGGYKEFTIRYGHDIGTSAFNTANAGGTQERMEAKHCRGEYNTEKTGFLSYPPPAGSYISDIMEVHNWDKFKPYAATARDGIFLGFNTTKLYVQFSKNDESGFGFGEDWLYCIDIGGMNNGKGPSISDTVLYAKPVTPPAMKMDTRGRGPYGDSLYFTHESVDPHAWHHLSWVGHTGSYGGYSTSLHWRNSDELGFMSNGNHTLDDQGANWQRMRARTHSSHYHMYQPGGLFIGNVGGNAASATSPASRDGAFSGSYQNTEIGDINPGATATGTNMASRTSFAAGDSWSNNDNAASFPSKNKSGQQGCRSGSHNCNMEWGRPYGWRDDFSVRPLRKGIVFLNNQTDFLTEEIGVVAFARGHLITDRMEYNRSTHKRRKWRHRKKRSYLQQRTAVSPKAFDNWVLHTANPWNLGVRQRCVPRNSGFLFNQRDYNRHASSTYNSSTQSYSTSYSWSVGTHGDTRREPSNSNLYTFRQAAYTSMTGFDEDEFYDTGIGTDNGSIPAAKIRHRLYKFKDASSSTDQSGFDDFLKIPTTDHSLVCVLPRITQGTGTGIDNRIILSYKGASNQNSYIGIYDFVSMHKGQVTNDGYSVSPCHVHTGGLEPNIDVTENVLVLEDFGQANLTSRLPNAGNNKYSLDNITSATLEWDTPPGGQQQGYTIDCSPTAGEYKLGRIYCYRGENGTATSAIDWIQADATPDSGGEYDDAATNFQTNLGEPEGVAWELYLGNDRDDTNAFMSIYKYSKLNYGIELKPVEVVVPYNASDVSADDAGYDTADEWHDAQNFVRGVRYYYKLSLVYDGFQESPLNSYYFTKFLDGDGASYANMLMTVKLSEPPKRVNAIVIYRKNAIEDYYRFVKEVTLDGNWAFKDNQYIRLEVDDGILSGSYESINGMPETLRNTNVNYNISCTGAGVLFAGDCWHPQIKNASNYLFKSQPGNFSIFDWSKDFLTLPSVPTSMVWYKGKLFVFDLNNTYRVNADMMAIEDTAEGTGCISNESYLVTDTGLFFCDYSNMYMHNGVQAVPLGTMILRNSLLDDEGSKNYSWQNIDFNRNPIVSFDPKIQTVRFMFEDKDGFSGSWNYNVPQQRFDLVEYPTPQSSTSGAKSEAYLSDGTYLRQLDVIHDKRKKWTFYSKTFTMGTSTIEKRFHNVKIVHLDAINNGDGTYDLEKLGNVEIWIDNAFTTLADVVKKTTTKPGQNASKYFTTIYKLASSKARGKTIQIRLIDADTEVESIGIVYTSKRVK